MAKINKSRRVFSLLALLLLTSCASTRAFTVSKLTIPTDAKVPAAWQTTAQGVTAAAQAPDLSRWWEALKDPTLDALIDRALQGNPDVRTAEARIRQARAERDLTKAGLLPSITASGAASGQQNSGIASFSPGFDASWEPDIFGVKKAGVDAASADLQATNEDLHAAQVSLGAEVALNYADLRSLQAREEIARRNADIQSETLQLTNFRVEGGLAGSTDVEQARANLEQTRSQIPSLQSGIAQTEHRLATLAGLDPSAFTTELDQVKALPVVPAAIGVGIPAETLRQRPDVRASEQRIIAETDRLKQADKQRYPQFKLTGSLGTTLISGALTGGGSLIASAASSVLQTIFDGGRIRQQINIQSATQEQAVNNYEKTVLTALEDVENALVSFDKTRERLDSLNTALTAAQNAALLASSQYSAGLTDFQTVLDTQRTVLSIQDSIAAAEGDRVTALVQLYKALGGGWSTANDPAAAELKKS